MARGDGSVFKRGETYWMKFYRDGRPVSMSCKTKSVDIARTKLRYEMRKSNDEFVEPRYKRVTVGDLFKDLQLHYAAHSKFDFRDACQVQWDAHLSSQFKDVKAALFSTDLQRKYRAARVTEGAANATINRELQTIRRAFRIGAKSEPPTVKRVPTFLITSEDNARKVFISAEQLDGLRVATAKESLGLRAALEMAYVFGWRRGELLRLRVKDVRLADGTVRLETSKNGDAREVPMTEGLRTLIEPLVLGRNADEPLLLTKSQFEHQWKRARRAAGYLGVLKFHDMRRTSARSKRAAGVDTSIIMEVQGWRTEAMFRRYGIVAREDKVAALAKLEAFDLQQKQLQNGYNTSKTGDN